MRLIFKFLLLFFILTTVCTNSKPQHQFGIGFSMINGAGLDYQVQIERDYALEFTGFGYYSGKEPPDDLDIYAVLGGNLQRTIELDKVLNYGKNIRLYFFGGMSFWYLEERSKYVEVINDIETVHRVKEIDPIWNFGLGFGNEYILLESFSLSAHIGLQYQISAETDFPEIYDRSPRARNFFGAGGGISLRILL